MPYLCNSRLLAHGFFLAILHKRIYIGAPKRQQNLFIPKGVFYVQTQNWIYRTWHHGQPDVQTSVKSRI